MVVPPRATPVMMIVLGAASSSGLAERSSQLMGMMPELSKWETLFSCIQAIHPVSSWAVTTPVTKLQ